MTSGLFASFAANQMQPGANSVELIGDNIAAILYPIANAPDQADLDSSILTIADLDAATGGSIGDAATHSVLLTIKTIGAKAPRVFSAGDTSIANPAAGAASALLFAKLDGVTPVSTDIVICFFEPLTPITPNGSDPIPINFPNGILKYGE